MIAGELPSTPAGLTQGSGPVSIDANVIQANLANDDGGGIRLLQVSGSNTTKANPGTISITNDTIANNVSAHEGGGLALDDAVFVDIVNTTVTKNITTATAVTSNGQPAAAGLTTAAISTPLQSWLDTAFAGTTGPPRNRQIDNSLLVKAGGAAWLGYSKPTLLNDVFWDNRAGTYYGGFVYGIGAAPLPGMTGADPLNNWDMQVVDQAAGATSAPVLSPVNSVVQNRRNIGGDTATTVSDANPGFTTPYDVTVSVLALRANPAFRQAAIVTTVLPFSLLGDYHLTGTTAVAAGKGTAKTVTVWGSPATANSFKTTATAPPFDIDGQARPTGSRFDAGSDQVSP